MSLLSFPVAGMRSNNQLLTGGNNWIATVSITLKSVLDAVNTNRKRFLRFFYYLEKSTKIFSQNKLLELQVPVFIYIFLCLPKGQLADT